MLSRALTAILVLAIALASPARADDYFARPVPNSTIKVRVSRSRTPPQRLAIWGLLGGGVLAGAAGVWFHLDSRDAAGELSVNDARPIGTWTPDRQDTYDRADRSGAKAILFYGLGGACLAGAFVVAALTHPGADAVDVRPAHARATFGTVPGGAVVGGAWRW